ncbi:type IV secretory system conjugative DNA transfer family protein [uncultured Jatrophihabitans sp.]|uniref:type IV secretory system conjugative DNA transfer family protein n=1 Tax=uncultured Jatrophihabitans sp. TaxID=1610747 RepID=UPI0035CA484B
MTLFSLFVGTAAVVLGIIVGARWFSYSSWRRTLVSYNLTVPSGLEPEHVATWLASLAALTHAPRGAIVPSPPVVFEIDATDRGIQYRLRLPKGMVGAVLASVRAAMPGARLQPLPDGSAAEGGRLAAAAVVLRGRRRQLAVDRATAVSLALASGMQPLERAERITWQWIFTSAGTPEPISAQTASPRGELPWWLEGDAPADADEIRAARLKQRQPLLHVAGRVVVRAGSRSRAWSLFGRVWGPVRLLNVPGAQLARSFWSARAVAAQALRFAVPLVRWPLLMNSSELAGLLALPLGETAVLGVPLPLTRQLPPPQELPRVGTIVADSGYPESDRPLAISTRDRLMHVALLGPTGTGKSTLMINMALQDAAQGDGLAVLDPKADMVLDLVRRLPTSRRDDLILINPADTDRPVGFNALRTDGSEQARELAVDHVLHVLHEQWKEFWGPRTDAVLRAGLLALGSTRAADGSAFTICELPALLTEKPFRQWVCTQSTIAPAVHDFFTWFEALGSAERTQVVGPVLNKLTAFTQRTPLRLMLGQSDGIDLAQVLREGKVLLMPLSRGLIGSETSALLSSLMMASLWQATLGRVRVPAEHRRPFWLYVDEASEVVRLPLDLADVMAEARGMGVGLTLAAQHLKQLPTPVRDALLATVRSRIIFQVEEADASLLSRSFAPALSADDLQALPAYEVAMRLCINGRTSRPVTGQTRPLPEPLHETGDIRAASRQRYGVDRAQVEQALRNRRQHQSHVPPVGRRPRSGGGRP